MPVDLSTLLKIFSESKTSPSRGVFQGFMVYPGGNVRACWGNYTEYLTSEQLQQLAALVDPAPQEHHRHD